MRRCCFLSLCPSFSTILCCIIDRRTHLTSFYPFQHGLNHCLTTYYHSLPLTIFSRERYRKELPLFLRWLSDIGGQSKNLVLYRETAAQHWNHTANGYFSYEFAHSTDFSHLTGGSYRMDVSLVVVVVYFNASSSLMMRIHCFTLP